MQILFLIEIFQPQRSTPPPRSTSLSRKQGQAAREPPKVYLSRGGSLHSSKEEKPLQRGLAFIYFSRRKAALLWVCACMCVFVRTIGKRTLEQSCQETVSHLPAWRAVFPFLLYQEECSWEPPSARAGRKSESLCYARERKRGGGSMWLSGHYTHRQ